jgi:uncharacterized protein HemX
VSEAGWVAIVVAVLGVLGGALGGWVTKVLRRDHDKAEVDDLITKRTQSELDRVYKRLEDNDKEMQELRNRLDATEDRADAAEKDARNARHIAAEMLAHIERLERMVDPPPPVRPWAMRGGDRGPDTVELS